MVASFLLIIGLALRLLHYSVQVLPWCDGFSHSPCLTQCLPSVFLSPGGLLHLFGRAHLRGRDSEDLPARPGNRRSFYWGFVDRRGLHYDLNLLH